MQKEGGSAPEPKGKEHAHKRTLIIFAIVITALAALLELMKIFSVNHPTPLQKIMLGSASHTCVAVLLILALIETWQNRHAVISKIEKKINHPELTLYGTMFLAVLIMAMMAASEYHHHSEREEKGSGTTHALAGVMVGIIGLAVIYRCVQRKTESAG